MTRNSETIMTREITIQPVLNGYICIVGCQRVVFQDRNQMLSEIGKYLAKPDDTEKRYVKEAVNKMPDTPQAICPPPACPPDSASCVAEGPCRR